LVRSRGIDDECARGKGLHACQFKRAWVTESAGLSRRNRAAHTKGVMRRVFKWPAATLCHELIGTPKHAKSA
jgi:hypothetical protein